MADSGPDTLHWYVAYVKSCQEKKTAEALGRLGLEYFLPIQKVRRKWSDRFKDVDQILIRGMIFIHCKDADRYRILEQVVPLYAFMTDRATGKTGSAAVAIIPDAEMNSFMFMVGHAGGSVRISTERFSPGDKVRITEGPLSGLECEVIKVDGQKTAIVRLGALGSALVNLSLDTIHKV